MASAFVKNIGHSRTVLHATERAFLPEKREGGLVVRSRYVHARAERKMKPDRPRLQGCVMKRVSRKETTARGLDRESDSTARAHS